MLSHTQSTRSVEPAGETDLAGHLTHDITPVLLSTSEYKFSPQTSIHAETDVKDFYDEKYQTKHFEIRTDLLKRRRRHEQLVNVESRT